MNAFHSACVKATCRCCAGKSVKDLQCVAVCCSVLRSVAAHVTVHVRRWCIVLIAPVECQKKNYEREEEVVGEGGRGRGQGRARARKYVCVTERETGKKREGQKGRTIVIERKMYI